MSGQTPPTPRRRRRLAKHLRRVALTAVLLAAIGLGAIAVAYFTSRGTATATARVGTVGPPTNVAAEQTAATVGISWDAPVDTFGDTVDGYRVTRSDGSVICGEVTPVTALSCSDDNVAGGTFTYTVTAVYGSLTASATTTAIVVHPPTTTLTPSNGHVGDAVTISGAAFPANASLSATFAGTPVTLAPAASTGPTGDIPDGVTFTVPTAVAGADRVLITAGGGSAAATFTVTPRVLLSPDSGSGGATAMVSGVGFAAASAVTATFGGAPLTLSDAVTDGSGALSASFTVPDQASGSHEVDVRDDAGNVASATFTIDAPTSLRLSAGGGYVGDTVTVGGASFGPDSTITATYDGASLPLSGDATTDTLGAIPADVTFVVPASTAGDHVVDLTAGGHSASATYTVSPRVTLAGRTGPVGSAVSISGSGFAADSGISARFGPTSLTLAGTTSTDGAGSFTGATFTVPSAPGGDDTVEVGDTATPLSDSASAVFTITPHITLSPSSGTAGSTVTVTGTGFSAGDAVTATFDGSSLTLGDNPTTDADGAFSATTFVVPDVAAGRYTVAAADASGHSADGEFIVGGTVDGLAPTSGPVGSSAQIRVQHFAANAALTVAVGGVAATISSGGSTAADGSADVNFTIPPVAGGDRSVTVSDGVGNVGTAAQAFTVTPQITLTPNAGEAGTPATITGTGFAALSTITATFAGVGLTLDGNTSDATGGFTAAYTVPNAAAGADSLVATDASGGTAAADYTITDPFVGVGPVGGPAEATTSSRADTAPSQAFAVRPITPRVAPRAQPIVARSRHRAERARGMPATGLTPATGPNATTVILAGSNFAAASTITATWDGVALALAGHPTTTRGGAVPEVTFTVPADAAAGLHTVSVGTRGEHATAVFTVTPTLTMSAASPQVAGTAFPVTITARAGGSTDTGYGGTKTLTFSTAGDSARGALAMSQTTVSFKAGVGITMLTLFDARSTTLTVVDAHVPSASGTSDAIVVTR